MMVGDSATGQLVEFSPAEGTTDPVLSVLIKLAIEHGGQDNANPELTIVYTIVTLARKYPEWMYCEKCLARREGLPHRG